MQLKGRTSSRRHVEGSRFFFPRQNNEENRLTFVSIDHRETFKSRPRLFSFLFFTIKFFFQKSLFFTSFKKVVKKFIKTLNTDVFFTSVYQKKNFCLLPLFFSLSSGNFKNTCQCCLLLHSCSQFHNTSFHL
jgi:hypothetical protein